MEYFYEADIKSVYDGDGSFKCDIHKVYTIDIGFNIEISFTLTWRNRSIRLFGVDTPEMRKEQREAGTVVRDFVREKILGKRVMIETIKDSTGKYGRLLAHIFVEERLLSSILLEKGYAKEYFGGTKEKWTEEELAEIIKTSYDN